MSILIFCIGMVAAIVFVILGVWLFKIGYKVHRYNMTVWDFGGVGCWLVALALLFGSIGGSMHIHQYETEASLDAYQNLEGWSKAHPEMRYLIEAALEDHFVSKGEYNKILAARKQAKKNTVKTEIIKNVSLDTE